MKYSSWFVGIAVVFVTCLITANIIAVKLIDVWGFIIPAGTIIFPISYIFGDVLTEVYGYSASRKIIWIGFACNLLTVVAIMIAGFLPAAPFWQSQSDYDTILGFTPRLLIASFLAYLFGEFANSFVLAKIKIVTQGRWLWVRTIGSTVVGQAFDSTIFMAIAFLGIIPLDGLLNAVITQWFFKSAYEALVTPLTYAVVTFLKQKEDLDTYDYKTSFNPFALTDKT